MAGETGDDGSGGGSLAMVAEVDTDGANTSRMETALRTKFDCEGTIWGAYQRLDGGATCHMMPWTNAPDIRACGARVESMVSPGVYEIVPPDGKFAVEEISEPFLVQLGGGRQYRVSLRFRGDTVKRSYLTFDLRGRGDVRPMAHEIERAAAARAAAPAAPSKPAAAPIDAATTAATMTMGLDPIAALMGRAVAAMDDPNLQLAFALVLKDSQREREAANERAAFLERQFQFMAGMTERLSKGGADGGVAALLRAQSDASVKAAAEASALARDLQARVHASEVAAAKGSGVSPPSPMEMALSRGLENALPAMAMKAMEMVPAAAPAVVAAAQAAMVAAPAGGA